MNTLKTNPVFVAYEADTGVIDYAKPTALFLAGPPVRYKPSFQEARRRGSKVFAYVHPSNLPDKVINPNQLETYMNGRANVPIWPYKTATGASRSNWPGTVLIDIRSPAWLDWLASFLGKLIASKQFDGVFLDTLGARLWNPSVAWDTWPVAEQQEWTAASVNLARRMHEKRMEIDPDFVIVHNNVWHLPPTNPQQALARSAEAYCDGVCLELSPLSEFHTAYANRTFSGRQRCVIVVSKTAEDAPKWADVQGVTHVCGPSDYSQPVAPLVAYNDLRDLAGRVAELEATVASLNDALDTAHAQLDTANRLLGDAVNARDALAVQLETTISALEVERTSRAAAELFRTDVRTAFQSLLRNLS